MTAGLFDEPDQPAPAPVPSPPPGLGQDAQRTWRNNQVLAEGIHPATRSPLASNGEHCRTCSFAYLKTGDFAGAFWKCSKARNRTNAGPDLRLKWPACTQYRHLEDQ